MNTRHSPEAITELDRVQQIHQQLENFALTTDLTRELESKGPEIISLVLAKYGVTVDTAQMTPTYFFLQSQKAAVTRAIGNQVFKNANGVFDIENGFLGILLADNDPALVCLFFHEHLHNLGQVLVVKRSKKATFRTGYDHVVIKEKEYIRRGWFLEEAVVDWLATKMTVEFLKLRGQFLNTLEVVQQSGGNLYYHAQAALHTVAAASPTLLPLFVQARFEPNKIDPLTRELSRCYGLGAAQILFSLPLDEDLIYHSVMELLQNQRT